MTKIPDNGGYLDPETGDWVATTNSRGDSEEENSRHSSSRAAKNTQVRLEISTWWWLSICDLFRLKLMMETLR